MLVVNELRQLLWVRLLDGIERGRLRTQSLLQPVKQAPRLLGMERPQQKLARKIDSTVCHVVAGRRNMMELLQDGLGLFGADGRDSGNFAADCLDVLL